MISNPDTQNKTATENKMGDRANSPETAKYAPSGASANPKPKNRWHKDVNLLV